MTLASFPAGGHAVEVDDSLCIVLRSPRVNGDDVELTVTNVDALVAGLHAAWRYQAAVEGKASAGWSAGEVSSVSAADHDPSAPRNPHTAATHSGVDRA